MMEILTAFLREHSRHREEAPTGLSGDVALATREADPTRTERDAQRPRPTSKPLSLCLVAARSVMTRPTSSLTCAALSSVGPTDGAQLQRADFRNAQLHDAIFGGAQLQDPVFGSADLERASFELPGTNEYVGFGPLRVLITPSAGRPQPRIGLTPSYASRRAFCDATLELRESAVEAYHRSTPSPMPFLSDMLPAGFSKIVQAGCRG